MKVNAIVARLPGPPNFQKRSTFSGVLRFPLLLGGLDTFKFCRWSQLHRHCNACKILGGGEFSLNQIIPEENFQTTKGNLKQYTYKGDSGMFLSLSPSPLFLPSPSSVPTTTVLFTHLTALSSSSPRQLSRSVLLPKLYLPRLPPLAYPGRQDRHPYIAPQGDGEMGQAGGGELCRAEMELAAADGG